MYIYTHIYYSIVYMGFPGGSVVKNLPAKATDMSSILGLERSPEEGNVSPFHYLCLGNSHGQRNVVDYSPGDLKKWHTT